MSSNTTTWYASWFDTPYYHILYKDRDYSEAGQFMQRLVAHLQLHQSAHIMDLACGRGRHSMYLNQLGYKVTGVDLSPSSIDYARKQLQEAKQHSLSDNLSIIDASRINFEVHNMTQAYGQQFDAVFNLFTSFGYFDDPLDNVKTIHAIKENLKLGAYAVIDFMNVEYVIKHLVTQNSKTEQGITFNQQRRFENGHIYKDIYFTDKGQDYHYTERVSALRLADFQSYFHEANLELIDVFGNYQLDEFDNTNSNRLIMILRRKS